MNKLEHNGIDNSHKDHKLRLRKRFERSGLDGFHNYEVLELILSYSILRKDTKQISKALLKKFGTITNIINAPVKLLTEIPGIGERSAIFLKLFKEVGAYHLKEEAKRSSAITSPEKLYDYFIYEYKGRNKETFMAVFLDTSNKIIGIEPLFKGTLNQAHVYIREIINKVILYSAKSIILVHNHPSGVIKPSNNDLALTEKIVSALSLIEVDVLDHLIIGDNKFLSFKHEGYL